jgi:glucoamylase
VEIYPINHKLEMPGLAIGRYPEDKYGGDNFNGGNPWPLCTLAIAEAYYKTAAILATKGLKVQAQQFIQKADLFVARVRFHAHTSGALNEQINRNTGVMTSVSDLTWNYAAILTTSAAREKALAATR